MRSATHLLISSPSILALGLCAVPLDVRAQGTTCCVVPDIGGGTADHPPSCPNGYTGHMEMVDGLPSGSTIQIPANLGAPGGFINLVQTPGGALGGMSETWQSTILMQLSGSSTRTLRFEICHADPTDARPASSRQSPRTTRVAVRRCGHLPRWPQRLPCRRQPMRAAMAQPGATSTTCCRAR